MSRSFLAVFCTIARTYGPGLCWPPGPRRLLCMPAGHRRYRPPCANPVYRVPGLRVCPVPVWGVRHGQYPGDPVPALPSRALLSIGLQWRVQRLAGFIDHGRNRSTPYKQCPPGHHVPPAQMGPCAPFASLPGSSDNDGDPGKARAVHRAGTFLPPGSAAPCNSFCYPAGTYAPDASGLPLRATCPAGTFAPESLVGTCFLCEVGRSSPW